LDDIINQIIQVDSVAFENEKKNEETLIKKKQECDNKITGYRNEKIAIAKKNAELIYENVEIDLEKEKRMQEEKLKKISIEMENRYVKIENDVIQKVFNKIFVLEW